MMGAGAGVVASLPTVIIGDRIAPPLKGIAIGSLRMAADTGMLLGLPMMGALADMVHLSAPFVWSGLLLGAIAWRCRASLSHRDRRP